MRGHNVCFYAKIREIIPVSLSYLEHCLLFKETKGIYSYYEFFSVRVAPHTCTEKGGNNECNES